MSAPAADLHPVAILAALDIERREGRPPRVVVVAYSGNVMPSTSDGPEIIDLRGITVPADVPILVDHRRSTDSIVGSGTAEVRDGKLFVSGPLAVGSPAGDEVLRLAEQGISLQASVGGTAGEVEFVAGGQTVSVNGRRVTAPPGGLRVVRKLTLREVSVVPVAADAKTSVSIERCFAMELDNEPAVSTADPVAQEETRIEEIRGICRSGGCDDLAGEAIARGWSPDQTARIALARKNALSTPVGMGSDRDRDGKVNERDALAATVLRRMGGNVERAYGARVAERADQLGILSLPDLCQRSLEMRGEYVPRNRAELVERSINVVTGTLPGILSDAASKLLAEEYEAAPAEWRKFCRIVNVANFKTTKIYRPYLTKGLEVLPETGDIAESNVDEESYEVSAQTLARMLTVSREAIVNDDLSALEGVPRMFAGLAARAIADAVYSKLVKESGTFFSVGNANTDTKSLDASNLALAVAAMRKQTDGAGNSVDIKPAVLVVAPELESTARAILASTELRYHFASGNPSADTSRPTANPVSGIVDLVVEPRLSNTTFNASADADDWYLLGGPRDMPLIVAFLEGRQAPMVETSDVAFHKLGVQSRCVYDFGVALGDHRAAYYNNAA